MDIETKATSTHTGVRLSSLLLGIVLPLALLVICLILLQWDDPRPLGEDEGSLLRLPGVELSALHTGVVQVDEPAPTYRAPAGEWPTHLTTKRIFASKSSIIVYGVILAGLLGSLLNHLVFRRDTTSIATLRESLAQFAAQLLVGMSIAFITSILLPLALMQGRYPQNTIGLYINSWSLLLLGGLSGYLSRSVLPDLTDAMSRVLAQSAGPLSDQVKTEIVDSIRTGVKDAVLPRALANYAGFVSVDIVPGRDRALGSTLPLLREGIVAVEPGRPYRLEMFFSTGSPPAGPGASPRLLRPISIEGGVEESEIPFDVTIDFGYVSIPLGQRQLAAPRNGTSQTIAFDFTTPTATGEPIPSAGVAEEAGPESISISIYQRGTFCKNVEIRYSTPSGPEITDSASPSNQT